MIKIFRQLAIIAGVVLLTPTMSFAQERILIHSHNDYDRVVPFYQAYAQGVASIEADVFISSDKKNLLVAHNPEDLANAQTIEEAYINPMVKQFKLNGGKPWKDSENTLTFLVDLKTPANPALDVLVAKLNKYPEVFNPAKNPYAVRVIISGNRPEPKDFKKYPAFINFDGDRVDYSKEELERITMISFNLKDYCDWNGKGTLKRPHEKAVREKIAQVHALNKPIRFWNTPDGVTAWNTMHNFGVDYINTDVPEACASFFSNFENKNYHVMGKAANVSDEVSRAKRLDKTTSGFQGFNNKLLQLSKGIDVYTPTYLNDGADKPIKNIIFLIGDGTGLNQLQAASTVNNPGYEKGMGLSIFNMKHIGFQNTSSKDAYTTDSAAGGSALATGELHSNRHISMTDDGKEIPSMTDYMYPKGYACGVITLGNLADATPAAYYGHSTERDNSDEITAYLLDGKLTVLNGSGMGVLRDRKDGIDLLGQLKKQYRISDKADDINDDDKKVICVDERMDLAASEETLDLLAMATRNTIAKLEKASDKGFFLMVEGAKIDYAGHANSLPGSVVEALSFDLAVAEALKFADSNGETLVIVTGDHETGGLTLVDGDYNKGHMTAVFVTDDHTPMMLPVYSYGPHANEFIGVYKNTSIVRKLKELLDL